MKSPEKLLPKCLDKIADLTLNSCKLIDNNEELQRWLLDAWSRLSLLSDTLDFYEILRLKIIRMFHIQNKDNISKKKGCCSWHKVTILTSIQDWDNILRALLICRCPKISFEDYDHFYIERSPWYILTKSTKVILQHPSLKSYIGMHITEIDLEILKKVAHLSDLVRNCKSLSILKLGGDSSCKELLIAAKQCPLNSISLSRGDWISVEELNNVFFDAPKVDYELYNSISEQITSSSNSAKKTNQIAPTPIDYTQLADVINSLKTQSSPSWTSLEILNIGYCRLPNHVVALLLILYNQLKELKLQNFCQAFAFLAQVLESIGSDSTLQINTIESPEIQLMNSFVPDLLPHLKRMNLSLYPFRQNDRLEENLTKIDFLTLSLSKNSYQLVTMVMPQEMYLFTQIKTLVLHAIPIMNGHDLMSIARDCLNLEVLIIDLSVTNPLAFNNKPEVNEFFPSNRLKTLMLYHLHEIRLSDIKYMLQIFPKIQNFQILTTITDDTYKSLSFRSNNRVKDFYLRLASTRKCCIDVFPFLGKALTSENPKLKLYISANACLATSRSKLVENHWNIFNGDQFDQILGVHEENKRKNLRFNSLLKQLVPI